MSELNPHLQTQMKMVAETCEDYLRVVSTVPLENWKGEQHGMNVLCSAFLYLYYKHVEKLPDEAAMVEKLWGASIVKGN